MASSKSPRAKRTRSIHSFSFSTLSSLRRDGRQHKAREVAYARDPPQLDLFSEPVQQHGWPAVPEPVLLGLVQRRKSKLAIFTSLRPSLSSESAGIPPHIHRKPVAATFPLPDAASHPPHYRQQEPQPSLDDLPAGLGLFSLDSPSRHQDLNGSQHPPPLPPLPPRINGHATKMPNLIQKAQKHNTMPQPANIPPPPAPPKDHRPVPPVPPIPQLTETQASPPMLRKTRDRKRSSSLHSAETSPKDIRGARLQPRRAASPTPQPRGRSSSAHPPSHRISAAPLDSPRAASNPYGARPQSAHSSDGTQSPARGSEKGKLRRSWLPGRSRANSQDMSRQDAMAWVMSPDSNAEYNVSFLMHREKVPELWNENGAVSVYLGPKGSGVSPSFKVPGYAVAPSRIFKQLIQVDLTSPSGGRSRSRDFGGRDSLSVDDAARRSFQMGEASLPEPQGQGESRLYLPVIASWASGQPAAPPQPESPDFERLVAVRNLFAFLTGQPLVGTKKNSTVFLAFLQIASLLEEFEFASNDSSSFGEYVDLSFGFYMGQLALGDVRHSREKSLEALVVAEKMKSWELYNEAFAHAVGKYSAITEIKSPLWGQISSHTKSRLGRASMDLTNRLSNVNTRLEQFDFPALFAGVANSTSNSDFRNIRFKNWKQHFADMRSFVLKYYKHLFGSWPPKASSKKNTFSESGLNRQVLKMLYSDLCSLYDLLVDRESLTPRLIDQKAEDISESAEPATLALRKMLGEFETSSPPVVPPIPFDIPKIPTMATIKETYTGMAPKDQVRFDKRIQSHELQLILVKSHNMDTEAVKTPFLMSFKEFELKAARNNTAVELEEQRIGYWLFLYVVLQSLPMLVVDAPDLHYTEGVEYFLCQPPQGNPPWVDDAGVVRRMWFKTADGSNVELSADVLMFSPEATCHRSHCWLAAKRWQGLEGGSAPLPPVMSPLEPPSHMFPDMESINSPSSLTSSPPPTAVSFSRGRSPHRVAGVRPSSMAMGLEPFNPGEEHDLPPPPSRGSRVSSAPAHHEHRSSSGSNLRGAMNNPGPQRVVGHETTRTDSVGSGSTFDAILQGMDNQKRDPKKKSFLPFNK